MEEKVLNAIRMITADKIMRRVEPHRALLTELGEYLKMPFVEIREVCVRLFHAGKIEGGTTMHDEWFKAIPTPDEVEAINKGVL